MTDVQNDVLTWEVSDHIACVTLSNPPVNALSPAVDRALKGCFEALAAQDDVRCAVVRAEGKCFSAGTDLNEAGKLSSAEAQRLCLLANAAFNAMEKAPFPVIAAVDGPAMGGGLELALACDMVVASRRATFGFPEVTIGVMPVYGGTQRLPRAVGLAQAKRMIFSGHPITCQRAWEMGLVQDVVDNGCAAEAALELARTIAANAPIAVRAAKRAMDRALECDITQGLFHEADASIAVFSSRDRDEGIRSFFEKRDPCFANE